MVKRRCSFRVLMLYLKLIHTRRKNCFIKHYESMGKKGLQRSAKLTLEKGKVGKVAATGQRLVSETR